MQGGDFKAFSRDLREPLFVMFAVGLAVIIGAQSSRDHRVVLVALLPIVVWLLFKPDWSFCLAIASLPLENVLEGDWLSLPKIVGGLALAAWVFSLSVKRRSVRYDAALLFMLLFISWGTLSATWSLDPDRTLETIVTYILLAILYFLAINNMKSLGQLDWALIALWAGGMISVAAGLHEMVTRPYLEVATRGLEGLTGNPNTSVMWALSTVPGFYWVVVRGRDLKLRVLAIAGLAAVALTSLLSPSRGGLISIAAFFLTLLAFRRTRGWGLILTLAAVVLAVQLVPDWLWRSFAVIAQEGPGGRLKNLWPAGWTTFQKNPWFGSGLGTNELAISGMLSLTSSVHNAPLAIAIEVGLPGLLLYLGFMAVVVFRLWKAMIMLDKQGRTLMGNLARVFFACFVAVSAVWFKGGAMEHSKAFWMLLALMSVLAAVVEQGPMIRCGETQSPDKEEDR